MNRSVYRAIGWRAAQGLMVALVAGFVAGSSVASAAAGGTNSPPVPDYRFIAQRNIFNPNRSPSSDTGQPNPRALAQAPGFALVGTMIYDKGSFAFFDGTESKYRKVATNSESIADYQVESITPKYVTLKGNGNDVTLNVGMQMKWLNESWQMVAGTDSSSGGSADQGGGYSRFSGNRDRSFGGRTENQGARSSIVTTSPASSGSSGGGGSPDEILRRMMQQREKELQR